MKVLQAWDQLDQDNTNCIEYIDLPGFSLHSVTETEECYVNEMIFSQPDSRL